ncbi:hypothetical protein BD779DRAFT_1474883 [Infundibulicybe gibba]|nr:hypothetical protein BD779DRAFT_1474883 [Infundibulicybe gibba]
MEAKGKLNKEQVWLYVGHLSGRPGARTSLRVGSLQEQRKGRGCKTKDKDRVMMVGNRNGLGFLQESESFPEDALIHSRLSVDPHRETKAERKAELKIGSPSRDGDGEHSNDLFFTTKKTGSVQVCKVYIIAKPTSENKIPHIYYTGNLVLDIRSRTIIESSTGAGVMSSGEGE